MLSYLTFNTSEIKDISIISLVISVMFVLATLRFSQQSSFIELFIQYFLFIVFLIASRLFIMKLIAYRHGIQLFLYQTSFSKYGPRKYDSISAFARDSLNMKFKGIPSSILAILIYIITFGVIIVPSLWRYKSRIIPHLYIGTREKFEYQMGFMLRRSVTDYRMMKILFGGFLYYFLFALVLKVILPQEYFYSWFTFIVFWFAFFTLLPIIGTEGYDLYVRSRLGYISAIVILLLGGLSLLIFESLFTILGVVAVIGSLVLFVIFYRYFL